MFAPLESGGGSGRLDLVLPMKAAALTPGAFDLLKKRQAHSKTRARDRIAAYAAAVRRPASCVDLPSPVGSTVRNSGNNSRFSWCASIGRSGQGAAPARGCSGLARVSFQLLDGVSTRPRLSRPGRPAFMGLRPIPRRLGRLHLVREYLQILGRYYLNTPRYTSCTIEKTAGDVAVFV
jgi:hypothetical protein